MQNHPWKSRRNKILYRRTCNDWIRNRSYLHKNLCYHLATQAKQVVKILKLKEEIKWHTIKQTLS